MWKIAVDQELTRGKFAVITARAPGLTAKAGLDRRMRVYLVPKVLIIDEMGYLVLDDLGATIFFQ
jgi:hypothetical protein